MPPGDSSLTAPAITILYVPLRISGGRESRAAAGGAALRASRIDRRIERGVRMAGVPARWDVEADVVSIGSGLWGLSAAIVAHDLGASCAVLEKAGKLG